ncbi:hypothetical protein SCB49_09740 [unidentified eubacterium SCB49]|nr:hypothetical protein SCB49_09740 [unidentified eubacterium SCB49]
MKKLMITAGLVLGSLTATMAQETASASLSKNVTEVEAVQAVQDYEAVDLKDVPAPVVKALETDFKDAKIAKVWKNSKEEYKVELLAADKSVKTVHATSDGKWIKKG